MGFMGSFGASGYRQLVADLRGRLFPQSMPANGRLATQASRGAHSRLQQPGGDIGGRGCQGFGPSGSSRRTKVLRLSVFAWGHTAEWAFQAATRVCSPGIAELRHPVHLAIGSSASTVTPSSPWPRAMCCRIVTLRTTSWVCSGPATTSSARVLEGPQGAGVIAGTRASTITIRFFGPVGRRATSSGEFDDGGWLLQGST